MSGWTLVEPCCGSAALTLHMLGARRGLIPYQGTKWPLRRELAGLARVLGFFGEPSRVVLADSAPWAVAVATVLRTQLDVLTALRPIVERGEHDPRETYAGLADSPVPDAPAEITARLLWLQRMNFASKAVGAMGGRWVVHGLNTTAAFGRAGTELFGAVRPLGQALLDAVELAPQAQAVTAVLGAAPVEVDGPTLVYLDPPYTGTTPYPSGHLDRPEVAALAERWRTAGASVVVSESEPIGELFGWRTERIRGGERSSSRQTFRRGVSGSEWVTWSRA